MDSRPALPWARVWLRYMLDTLIGHVDTCIFLLLQAKANVAPFYNQTEKKCRPKFVRFLGTAEISLTHKFCYHHHFPDTRYSPNDKFQANRRKLKIRPFFWTAKISPKHKFHYHHHFQDTQYTLSTKFQTNLRKLKIRPIFRSEIDFNSTIVFCKISIFMEIGQSWNFANSAIFVQKRNFNF